MNLLEAGSTGSTLCFVLEDLAVAFSTKTGILSSCSRCQSNLLFPFHSTFLHQHMFSAKLAALSPQTHKSSASYPGAAQFGSPAVLCLGFIRAGRRFQSGPAMAAGEHLTLKYQNPSENISTAEFLTALCCY